MAETSPSWPPRIRFLAGIVRVGGRRFRLRAHDVQLVQLMTYLLEQRPAAPHVGWLIPHRPTLRQVLQLNARVGLTWLVECATESWHLRLALWLRGRCGGALGTPIVAKCLLSTDELVRKEAVRALRRMNAWAELHAVAEYDANPRLRRLASCRPPPDLRARVERFTEHIRAVPYETRSRPLYVAPSVALDSCPHVRSRSYIREILDRIRRLVRGAPTSD